jgi:hypothetical protein
MTVDNGGLGEFERDVKTSWRYLRIVDVAVFFISVSRALVESVSREDESDN